MGSWNWVVCVFLFVWRIMAGVCVLCVCMCVCFPFLFFFFVFPFVLLSGGRGDEDAVNKPNDGRWETVKIVHRHCLI